LHQIGLDVKLPLSLEQRARVSQELHAILSSEAFAGSRRGQQFLQYVVEESLAGRSELLKERSIGVDLFSRSPSYDTGNDSVVRVTAGDVRQRLKQYEEHEGVSRPVHIHLPLGSYVPEYSFATAPATLRPARRFSFFLALALLVGVALAAGIAYLGLRLSTNSTERFWTPLQGTASPVLICIGNPDAYSFPRAADRLGPKRKPGDVVHVEEISPMPMVHPHDAEVAIQLSSFLGAKGIATRVRSSTSTSFEDLRASPALMIGAFSNQWTIQMTKELHFAFVQPVGQEWGIREQTAPWRHWEISHAIGTPQAPSRDYGLISRIFNRETGQAFVAIGGISSPGTVATAECVMSATCLETALKTAPRDWEHKNMQIVITARVVADTPGAPEVITAYFW